MDLSNVTFQPSSLSAQVGQALKQLIIQGHFCPGDKLPTEAELSSQLKVSIGTVREALKHLEAEGLIQKRRGAYGGNFITVPGSHLISNTIKTTYQFGGISHEDLLDLRRMLEPVFIRVAAERRSDKDLKEMATLIEKHDSLLNIGKKDYRMSIRFHQLIAKACHNVLVSAIIDGLIGAYNNILGQLDLSVEEERIDVDFNKKFYETILVQDGNRAQQLMIKHFDHFESVVKALRAEKDA